MIVIGKPIQKIISAILHTIGNTSVLIVSDMLFSSLPL
jgi:ribonucleotide monophosphatase NagD (HAD superfamily)